MAFFDRDKNATAGCASFSAGAQRAVNRRAVTGEIDNVRGKEDRTVGRSRPEKFDRVLSGHGARWMIRAGVFHQMISRGPVAVTIEQRPNDFAIFWKAADA